MEFEIGQIFNGVYPPEAADWCNDRGDVFINEISEGVYQIQVIPPESPEEIAERIRQERDSLLDSSAWILERYRSQKELGEPTENTEQEYQDVLRYRQALRDIPQQPGFPESVEFPKLPPALGGEVTEELSLAPVGV